MANFSACGSLFMLLILSNLFLFSQGRNLAASTQNVNLVNDIKVTLGAKIEEKITKMMGGRRGFRLMEGSVDAYHFATPGHSPGIGHSKHD
ncbi:hypothetical protein H5410_006592 [Solanum commersonii]|uniref:Transmembrane protein n=1 Tax=Solanum commersonii TaxID=4109 RepID=A0A9J6A9K6_SOLCO|nr:hypothetical protein H5410_006592 [Solanum commersonii]